MADLPDAPPRPNSDNASNSHFDVLGVRVAAVPMEEVAHRIEAWAKDDCGRFICMRDVASLMAIVDNRAIAGLHRDAAMVLPDGMPLVWIGKLGGLPVERVCGPDLMEEMMRRSAATGLRHYFYGGKAGVAEQLARHFRLRFPGVQIVGTAMPPFRDLTAQEQEDALAEIIASDADVVWIGISSPKQDVWMWENVHRLPQTLIGVGAAFDFHSGQVRRAPRWMQRYGLEWLFRLMSEPRRLWRRYLLVAPQFVWRLLTHRTGPAR